MTHQWTTSPEGGRTTLSDESGLLRGNASTIILAVLRDGARHGYEIAREVERRSENSINFRHATLYTVLHLLEEQGLITSVWEHPEGERSRRVYSLTTEGLQTLDKALVSWDRFASAMNEVLGRRTGEQAV
jgi:PadR family transcriptional regulator, regulatory protein PadR